MKNLRFSIEIAVNLENCTRDNGSPRFRRQTVRVPKGEDGREKFRNFVAWAEPDPKQHFRVFRVPFDYPAHSLQEIVLPKPMIQMESRDSEGVPFASQESLL